MNEIRRAGLEQIAAELENVLGRLTDILDAERSAIQDLPDNIEDSEFSDRFLKRPMFELAATRVHVLEATQHIAAAMRKVEA